jgi:ubiquinone/menaquinone biosynthesis C-methylase UbiE
MQPRLVKACCADLYQSPLARLALGDTLHLGGLALTQRLGRLMNVQPGAWVVDLASGRGDSAMAVSRRFQCNVVGIEFNAKATAEAQLNSLEAPGAPRAFFLRGDAESPPLRSGSLDGVFCECSMSLFADKAGVVKEAVRMLKPGGRFGMSDFMVEPDCLPAELKGVVGQALCLADALDLDGYTRLLRKGGLNIQSQEDASPEILKLLDDLESKIGVFAAWQNFIGTVTPGPDLLQDVPVLIGKLRELAQTGKLGYWLLVGEKP